MHRILEGEINNIKGSPFKVAKKDGDDIVWKDKDKSIPELTEATVSDVFELVIFNHPPQTLTRQDSIHASRLYDQLHPLEAKDTHNGYVELEDAEWDWMLKKLEDDKVGPLIFGIHLKAVEDSLKKLEKQGEEQRKGKTERAEAKAEAKAVRKNGRVKTGVGETKELVATE